MYNLLRRIGKWSIPGAAGALYGGLFVWFVLLTCFICHGTAAAEIFIPEGNYQTTREGVLLGAGGVTVDRDGNVFVADPLNYVVRSYLPDGTPLRVFGREFVAGTADGPPVDARFTLPGHLSSDPDGNILVADGNSLIRRIDAATLAVTTVADLSANVDGTQLYDIYTGLTFNKGILDNLVIGDLSVRPNGEIFVTAANYLGVIIYLVRISGNEKKAVAFSEIVLPTVARWGRGVAVDAQGDVLAEFPGEVTSGGSQPDYIFRFPGGAAAQVVNIGQPSRISRGMTTGLGGWLYLASDVLSDPVIMVSSTNAATLVGTLQITQTFPQNPTQCVHDVAVSPQGIVYAMNYRIQDNSGYPSTNFAKVDRFPGIDIPIGQQSGDTLIPDVALQSPTAGQLVESPIMLRATASDNSGSVLVQFRIDGKTFGPPITAPPFERLLDPELLPDGNHDITVIARDPAGNARTTPPVIFRTVSGFPNLDGEVFVADRQLTLPLGVATDNTGDVYVADVTKILRFSPSGALVATYGNNVSAQVDGGAAQVRFGKLKGLGRDQSGRILIVDDIDDAGIELEPPRIRRLDPVTGITGTVVILDEAADIDVGNVYNVTTGEFEDLIAISDFCQFIPCDFGVNKTYDVTVAPTGEILVSAWEGYGPDFDSFTYLIRHSASGNTALARSTVLYSSMESDRGARGVAVDGAGGVIASFPTGTGIVDHSKLMRFPADFPSSPAALLLEPIVGDGGITVDPLNRLLVTLDAAGTLPGRVDMVPLPEATQPTRQLARRILDKVHDVAVDGAGNVYVTSTEYRLLDKVSRTVSRVTRFGAAALAQSPRLVDRVPEAGATGVALNSQVKVTFSEEMNTSTITKSNFFLSGGVDGTIICDVTNRTATFSPLATLAPATTYTVTLTTGIRDAAGNPLASNKTWEFTTTDHQTLTVTIAGSGTGTVNSATPGVSFTCELGTCRKEIPFNTTLNLYATPSGTSLFSRWTGACTNTSNSCSLTLDANKDVTATFSAMTLLPLMIPGGSPGYYHTFGEALGDMCDNASVALYGQATTIPGGFTLNRPVYVTFSGGYDGGFQSNSGGAVTFLQGTLTIGRGSLTVEKLSIR